MPFRLSYETDRSEYIVKGNGPGILIISFAAFGIYAECIFPVEIHILLKCYISHSIPEAYIGSSSSSRNSQIAENICLEPGAAEEYTPIDIIVSHINRERARLLQVQPAVADACIPRSVIADFAGGVLPVFAECTEFTHRNSQVDAEQFIVIALFLEYEVIRTEFRKAEIISAAGIICIIGFKLFIVKGVERTEAGGRPECRHCS